MTSKKIYLASDILFAFVDRMHPRHSQAEAYFRYFAQESLQLFTDQFAIFATYEKMSVDISTVVAKDFLRIISTSSITILTPDEGDMKAATKVFLYDKSNELTFEKAILAVMADRKGISQICTFSYMQTLFGLSLFYLPM